MSDSLQPHGLQHARLPCPSLSPRACPSSCLLSRWHHPTTSSFVTLFSFCLQSFPASETFPMSQIFISGGQSIGVSASTLMNIQDWFPLGFTGLIFLLSKGLSRVFSSTTVQKHQFFGTLPSLWPNSHNCTWLLGIQVYIGSIYSIYYWLFHWRTLTNAANRCSLRAGPLNLHLFCLYFNKKITLEAQCCWSNYRWDRDHLFFQFDSVLTAKTEILAVIHLLDQITPYLEIVTR